MRGFLRRAVVAFGVRNRRRKASAIARYMTAAGARSVAFVGVGGTEPSERGRAVETAIAPLADFVTALDIEQVETPWLFVVGDARSLPWRDDAVDVVISNAVIEHVGDEYQQARFVAEHCRVGREWVITTPNRWFPVEPHTSTVFKHWSRSWRAERSEFTRLLSKREFRQLLPVDVVIIGRWWSPTFIAFKA